MSTEVRRQLARRYLRMRLLLVLAIGAWFVAAPTGYVPLFLLGPILLFGTGIVAGFFPNDLHSPAGRQFVLPGAVLCAVCAALTDLAGFFASARGSHINDECRRVHAVHCLLVFALWTANALLCVLGRGTWRVLRTVFVFEGLSFCCMALAMRCFGPPPVYPCPRLTQCTPSHCIQCTLLTNRFVHCVCCRYPPRNGSFGGAVTRGLTTISVGLLLSTAARNRLAALANRFRWNHVSLTLHHVQRAPRRVRFRANDATRLDAASQDAVSQSETDAASTDPYTDLTNPDLSASSRGAAERVRCDGLKVD
jgi:hypothetical protein